MFQILKDVHKDSIMDDEGEDYEGGINIQDAIQRQQEADKHDKQLYREKIKLRHRVSV